MHAETDTRGGYTLPAPGPGAKEYQHGQQPKFPEEGDGCGNCTVELSMV